MAVAFAALAYSAVSAATVYTVTTDSLATYESPLSLETANVAVDNGITSVIKPFSELVGAFETNSVFCKRGEGYLRSTPLLKTFTGEIRIEEGGWMVVTNGCLGVVAKAWAPKVVISNGASLVVCPTKSTCPGYKAGATGCLRMYNPMTFEGDGYEERGAISVDSEVSMAENGFSGDWTLSGDAVFASYTSPQIACTSLRYVYINGHTFTFKNKGVRGVIVMPQSFQAGGDTAKLVLDGISCRMQSSAYQWWNGDAASELILTNGSTLGYYNFNANPQWTLVTYDGSQMSLSGTERYPATLGSSGYYDTWGGPVKIAEGVFKITGETYNRGARFFSTVSGKGGIYAQDVFLQLHKAGNSFAGPVTVALHNSNWGTPGLALHCNGALPVGIPSLTVTNAPVYLGKAEDFKLPAVNVTVSSGSTQRLYGLASDAVLASLVKSGAGTLKIEVPFSVTGRTEIAGGTLVLPRRTNTTARLYSALPGLWRGVSPVEGAGAGTTDTVVYSNDVDGCFAMLGQKTYPPWVQNRPTIWGGYIWNRSPTNETWTFAVSARAMGRVYVDGSQVVVNDNYGAVNMANKTMTPGAHTFRFAVNPRTYSSPGSGAPDSSSGYSWSGAYGIAIDRNGRKTKNYLDFEFPMNDMAVTNAFGVPISGGDGSLFTRDSRDTNEFTRTEIAWAKREALFAELCLAPGTVIDLSGADDGVEDAPFVVETLCGCGEIRNGSLSVAGKWTLDATSEDGWPLAVPHGDLTFMDGVVLDCDIENLRSSFKGYVIAVAGGVIRGMPQLSERLLDNEWMICTDPSDASRLLLCKRKKSLRIIVR